jgi:hypothetical protein
VEISSAIREKNARAILEENCARDLSAPLLKAAWCQS